jgi:hypothetical protein
MKLRQFVVAFVLCGIAGCKSVPIYSQQKIDVVVDILYDEDVSTSKMLFDSYLRREFREITDLDVVLGYPEAPYTADVYVWANIYESGGWYHSSYFITSRLMSLWALNLIRAWAALEEAPRVADASREGTWPLDSVVTYMSHGYMVRSEEREIVAQLVAAIDEAIENHIRPNHLLYKFID